MSKDNFETFIRQTEEDSDKNDSKWISKTDLDYAYTDFVAYKEEKQSCVSNFG